MRLKELLSRADDETLQHLLGEAPMKLILSLDPSLATPQKLRDLIIQVHTSEGLLLSSEKRAILFDLLPQSQANFLHQVLELRDNGNVYASLKSASIRSGSEREKALFEFFGLSVPVREVHEQPASIQLCNGNYPLFAHQRTAVREIVEALEKPPHRAVLHMGRPLRTRAGYRQRWKVERYFGWMDNCHRLVVRYDRHLHIYRVFCLVAIIL